MTKRGYKHRRSENQFTIRGEYTRNLQFVYSKERMTQAGRVVDLVYFAADILSEKLVIGLYRENADMENGIYVNASRSLDLVKFNAKELDRVLDQLVTPMRDKLK
jgi:hypothetical protein